MNAIKRSDILWVALQVVPLTQKGMADLWSALKGTFGNGDSESLRFGSLKKATAKKVARVDGRLTTTAKDLALTVPVRAGYWLADASEKVEFGLLESGQLVSVCPSDVRDWLNKFEAEKPQTPPKP